MKTELLLQASIGALTLLILDTVQTARALMGCVTVPVGNGLDYFASTADESDVI